MTHLAIGVHILLGHPSPLKSVGIFREIEWMGPMRPDLLHPAADTQQTEVANLAEESGHSLG